MAPRSRRASGRGRRGGRGGASMFVDGGWLADWKPSGKKKRPQSEHTGSVVNPNPAQPPQKKKLVLCAQPGRAAVYEDKGPVRSLSSEGDVESDEDDDEDDDGFSSSIDSELAEDYVDNLAEDFSVDELTYVSANEQEYHDLFPSSDDEDDGDPYLKCMDMDEDDSEDSLDEAELAGALMRQAVVHNRKESPTEAVEPSFVLYTGRDLKKKKKVKNVQRALPGEKKHLRKEGIAAKRRERASRRGVDMERINLMLEGMVLANSDIISLHPMKNKDLSLVSKLAAVYRLKLACQGSGKKRFATVIRTRHTCLPQGDDTEHLRKLLGNNPVNAKGGEAGRMAAKYKRAARQARQGLKRDYMSNKGKGEGGRRVMRKEAVSFISSGVIQADGEEMSSVEQTVEIGGEGDIGRFEAHTKGFGSRMLAKMGYVQGGGLGRDGQGMKQALLPQMRPRALGLGAARH